MGWFKVEHGFSRHPKAVQCSEGAIALWLSAACYVAEYETDGKLSAGAIRALPRYTAERAEELFAAGLWDRDGEGAVIHEWLERQISRQQAEAKREQETERKRLQRVPGSVPALVPGSVPAGQGLGRGPVSPTPTPDLDLFGEERSVRKGEGEDRERTVLAALNAARGRVVPGARPLKATPGNLQHIAARLAEGHGVDDCLHVIAVCEAEVRDDASKARWFNQTTPFRPDNFARNLAQPAPEEAQGHEAFAPELERLSPVERVRREARAAGVICE